MRRLIRIFWVFIYVLSMCFTSCLNEAEDPNYSTGQLPANVATLDEQVVAMKSTVDVLESLHADLTQVPELQVLSDLFETCAISVREHISNIESGLSGVEAVMVTMELQSAVAYAAGTLNAELAFFAGDNVFQTDIVELEAGISTWLGKDFNRYFEVSAEQARLEYVLEVLECQALSADALASDVEAGLRVGDASGLEAILENIGRDSEILISLAKEMGVLCDEVEQGYVGVIKSESKVDLQALNAKAATAVSESVVTLNELISRISESGSSLDEINKRLEKVEADIDALLGMIQSLTFLSDYSEEYAVAYYEMGADKVSAPGKAYDGKALRTKVGTVELNYMVFSVIMQTVSRRVR